jgi:hypothetical protein
MIGAVDGESIVDQLKAGNSLPLAWQTSSQEHQDAATEMFPQEIVQHRLSTQGFDRHTSPSPNCYGAQHS